ncbi:Rrf2 family transcriptional regulator [Moheibacter lacus]|uniref:Rrf2 family transcriptional regulator n=1 Tax=Moheibacter lacus TaxID=2745851 RepID=A0A838ZQY5_9FLAO|nr:Rrf2 family transcriptional regulator [Moheibacter lacus]MBA5628562.1 Rrf2 family transcriptional regulator [Moheibacter lacus]
MNNTRFATAIHILTLLKQSDSDWLSSEWIAGSIGVNPVVVRKEIGVLKKAGLIESQRGKEGGCRLRKTEINLAEIYLAVKNSEVLGKKNLTPNPNCDIGKDINKNLDKLFQETDEQVVGFLGNCSLEEFALLFA